MRNQNSKFGEDCVIESAILYGIDSKCSRNQSPMMEY